MTLTQRVLSQPWAVLTGVLCSASQGFVSKMSTEGELWIFGGISSQFHLGISGPFSFHVVHSGAHCKRRSTERANPESP